MARIIVIGRLTRDVEMRYSQGADSFAIAAFSIAENKKFKKEGQPEASFWDCVAFRGKAEFIGKYFKKGSKVVVDGIAEDESYVDKNGVKRTVKRITVDDIEFADSKSDGAGTTTAQPVQTAQPTQPVQTATVPQATVTTQAKAPAPAKAPVQKARAAAKPVAPAQAPAPAPQAVLPQQSGFMNVEGFDMSFINQ